MAADAQARYAARRLQDDPDGWRRHRQEIAHAHRRRNPEKARAWKAVYRAVRSGRLVRPEQCSSCQTECRPEASHTDYSKPLEVEWLCRSCHAKKDYAC